MTHSDDSDSDNTHAGTQAPSAHPAPTEAVDSRRRAALAKLGKTAAYAVPATVSLMAMSRSARACV
ncbi:hypothetical protein [Ancylobacter sp. FA202]|uniref:hypothetical protein n=1 Tax=Ancylobacter sp. FA202 TaxID=1111106 RepID=UPI000373ED3D|nr:hypothetical protein [Ancylobacter sp. FA202]